eukprot:1153714-Pelagomonas_calceolata.AAC.2
MAISLRQKQGKRTHIRKRKQERGTGARTFPITFIATLPDSGYGYTLFELNRLFGPMKLLQSVISVIPMIFKMKDMCCSDVPIPRSSLSVISMPCPLSTTSIFYIFISPTAQCVYSGQPINIKDYVVDLRKRHRSVWPTEDQAEHDGYPDKLATYHNWVALPCRHNSAFGKPLHVPRYLNLDLGRHMQRNIACFRLHAHKLRVETSLWQGHSSLCDFCGLVELQDVKHVIFCCSCNFLRCLRRRFAHLFAAWMLKDISPSGCPA